MLFVDMWPASACNCLPSCDHQSQLVWDFSFTQISPLPSFHSATFSPAGDHAAQSAASWVVRLRCEAADAVARRSLAGDTDQISVLGAALDRLADVVDRLQADLAGVARTCSATLGAVRRRLVYHAVSALRGGVQRVFQEAFVAEFERVRLRSVQPLMEVGHETVANVERTIKQLRFTATSENVARKVLHSRPVAWRAHLMLTPKSVIYTCFPVTSP